MSDGIEAIKQIHSFGEYNVLLSILYVAIVIVAIYAIGRKIMDVLGLETKASLYKKAQEQRITDLENTVDEILKKIDDNQDSLYKKQKGYHEESIQIRDQLRQSQDGLKNSLDEIKSLIINDSIESMRWEILDFSSSIMAGREFNKEQYDHVLNTHERYEKILEENGMTNGQTTASFEFIKKHYDELMEHGFENIKDRTNKKEDFT